MHTKQTLTLLSVVCVWSLQWAYADVLTYDQAEAQYLDVSHGSKASAALQQAATYQAQAVKHLGLPRVDVNVRAYKLQAENDVPLDGIKRNLTDNIHDNIGKGIDQLQSDLGLPPVVAEGLEDSATQAVDKGISSIPDSREIRINKSGVSSSVSMNWPIYTGGIINSTQKIAQINADKASLGFEQQQDLDRLQLVQMYFGLQLNQQLTQVAAANLEGMQHHVKNALILERQGFISKGQRMQFEVARNNSERLYNNSKAAMQNSRFELLNALQSPSNITLSTPLFVNNDRNQNIESWLKSYPEGSHLLQKIQMDTDIAKQNIAIQKAAFKPKVFAFGEYALDDDKKWIIGVGMRYNLISGMDRRKSTQAAESTYLAAQLSKERVEQEIEKTIFKAYSEMETAQQNHALLKNNMLAAIENRRIQTLSFREDAGTATQVIDAQNMVASLKAEQALNAYKYIMALAVLLNSTGNMEQFKQYAQAKHTDFIHE